MGKKNDNTLVKNASFLMIAALISKIIGMLYKSPLSNTLGNSSMGLFNYAQNVYFILLMIASFSIPQAVSKIMAEKLAFKRYRDAQKVFHCALLYVAAMGGVVALFCFFGSSILVPESMSGARLALKMLAPTIFLSGILGTFRGYFQAYRNMLPTSLSQIVEQCFVAVFAILMSSVMLNRFSGAEESVRNAWGAAGATMGTGAGVASALLFMLFVYGVNKKTINKRLARDTNSRDEATGEVMKNIVLIVMPIILSSFIYNVNGFINSYMYSGIQGFKGIDHDTITSLYAEYGYYMTLINIPLTLASTAPTSMIPEVSAQYAKHDMDSARDKIDRATWISMFISIPCAVGLGSPCRTDYQASVPKNGRGSSAADDAWCHHHHPQRKFQYFQRRAPGNRQAQYSDDQCGHCPGGGCDCHGNSASGDGPWSLFHCHCYDYLCSCHVSA